MAAASKHIRIEDISKNKTCQDFYHAWTPSCWMACLDMWVQSTKGSCKFYMIIYAVNLILKRRKINADYMKIQCINFLKSISYGSGASTLFVISACLVRNGIGKFTQYTTIFLPGVIGGLAIIFEETRKQEFYLLSYFTIVCEYISRKLIKQGVLEVTNGKLCAWFMVVSAFLMYLLKIGNREDLPKTVNYWVFMPPESGDRFDQTGNKEHKPSCYHKNSCWNYALKDARKYLGFGMALQGLRTLFSQINKVFKRPGIVLWKVLSWKTMSLGLFLGTYALMYHIVNCMLFKYEGRDSEKHALIAGFIAGISILLHPKLSIFFMATSTILQQILRHAVARGIVPPNRQLLVAAHAFLNGVNFHIRVVDSDTCHPVIKHMVATCTSGRSEAMVKVYKTLMEQYISGGKLQK